MDTLHWWQKAVFYQIYPRSFADGNGDGIGDFKGITAKLDYLKELGVDGLWLSPHFPSPQADCGYDVADYVNVEPEYGTLDDFKVFLDEAHKRDIRVILDMVFNHTSDRHAWFAESRSSCDNPKHDWYVWRDGRIGPDGERLPPNNWESAFTGSAWEYVEARDQYYYHYFLKEQPDLNWRNPQVRAAMWDAVRFWLDMGVDGFRLDAIGTIFEHPDMPDHTATMTLVQLFEAWEKAVTPEEHEALQEQWKLLFENQVEQPGMHELMQELRTVVNAYPDAVLVGETDDVAYYGDGQNELHLVFNFPLMNTDHLTPTHARENQQERQELSPAGAWPCNTLGNHDNSRVWTRYADGEHDRELAQVSLALLLTLRGTPFLYNGEEIGMTDLILDDLDQIRDVVALRQYALAVAHGMPPEKASEMVRRSSRDRCRTPLQWDNAPQGGFCPAGVAPWLPVNPNYAQGVNAAEQMADPGSLWHFYKRILALRRRTPALIAGDYTPLLADVADCLCFLRTLPAENGSPAQTCLVVLNFSAQAQTLAFDELPPARRLLFSSVNRAQPGDLSALTVAPYEIYIAAL